MNNPSNLSSSIFCIFVQMEAVEHIIQGEKLQIIPLGAGNEVGRSCIVLKFRGKTVMFDCGIHPGLSGLNALPGFDDIEID